MGLFIQSNSDSGSLNAVEPSAIFITIRSDTMINFYMYCASSLGSAKLKGWNQNHKHCSFLVHHHVAGVRGNKFILYISNKNH